MSEAHSVAKPLFLYICRVDVELLEIVTGYKVKIEIEFSYTINAQKDFGNSFLGQGLF